MEITMDTDEPIDEIENEELEDELETEQDNDDDEPIDDDEPEGSEGEADSEEDTLIVTIGDDEVDDQEEHTSEAAPDWVKEVRNSNKEMKKKLKEYEARDAEAAETKAKTELGEKPKFDDYEYGQEDKFADDVSEWKDRAKALEDKKRVEADKNAKYDDAYKAKLARYDTKKNDVPVDNFDEVEDKVKGKLSVQQHSIAVHLMEKPEMLILALGNNSKELERLAGIEDALEFAFQISKIEDKLKMTTRKRPSVHKPVGGSGKKASSDNKLDQLRAKAHKSGDMTEVIAYKREQKEALRKAS
jgi:hypothetical protein